ncbi:MAG: DUF3256 family protein [Bacteroidales bacterium]|nr:DUF3256 family protein [Bacteroidales bacterium]
MNKMKTILSTLLLLVASSSIQAQSLKDLFLKMPQNLCPALSEYNRLEIVDNQKNQKVMQTRNLFRTYSKMEELTDDYARLTVTKNSQKEMKLLTLNDETKIIMVVSTILVDDTPDSSVAFYSTDWQPLPAQAYLPESISEDIRKIEVESATGRLTITTNNAPLLLNYDGVKPTPIPTSSSTYAWKSEQGKYVKE